MEETKTMASLIQTVIQKRQKIGLSQRQLARACGVSQSSIVRLEAMDTLPRLDTLIRVCSCLGLQVLIHEKK